MFDNKIDWVNVFGSFCIRREASNEAQDSNAFEYKAEHKIELEQVNNSIKCSIMKSVFRSYGFRCASIGNHAQRRRIG